MDTSRQQPNALGLTDGTMYDIAGLSEEKVQELVSLCYTYDIWIDR